jgi:Flp pilus assembly protein TadD
MRTMVRSASLLLSAAVLALTGCQSFPFSGVGGFSKEPGPDFIPNVSSMPLDGNGEGAAAELPARKKLAVCQAAARTMEKEGKLVEAIYYYEQIRTLDPRNEITYTRHLATLYDRKGDFDKALDEYQKLLKANPKDSAAYNDLGYGYYNRGKFEPAEQNLRKAVELDPKNKRAWSNLGMTLAQLGRYEEGVAAFEKVVTKPQAYCNVGYIQLGQGKWMEARDSYARALQLEPGLQKAQFALQKINDEASRAGSLDRERIQSARKAREAEAARAPMFGAYGEAGGDSGMLVIGPERPLSTMNTMPQTAVPSGPLPPIPLGPLPGTVRSSADPLPPVASTLPDAPPPSVLSLD